MIHELDRIHFAKHREHGLYRLGRQLKRKITNIDDFSNTIGWTDRDNNIFKYEKGLDELLPVGLSAYGDPQAALQEGTARQQSGSDPRHGLAVETASPRHASNKFQLGSTNVQFFILYLFQQKIAQKILT